MYEKKNFENGLLCTYIPTCDLWAEPVLNLGHHMIKLGRGSQVDAITGVRFVKNFANYIM